MMKILIVDDDEDSRVFLERELRGQHYDAESATNGVEALGKAYKWHPDLIISDILMPEMNGFELCRRIKTDEQLRNIPFIFYTATFVDQKDEKLAMELGASRFLIKPIEPADFLRIVSEVISEYEENKLSVPGRPLGEMKDLCTMQAEALARKLDKKVRELDDERKSLRESEEKFRALTESTSDWIWEVDRNGVYTYSSPKVRDLLGYGPEDVIGKTMFDFMSSDEAKRVAKEFKTIWESKKPFAAFQYVTMHKDGRKVVLEKSGVPFFRPPGNLEGYRGIDRDITERNKLEEQLLQAQKMEAVGQLAGGIAHDFNNILTAITGFCYMLKKRTRQNTETQEFINDIHKAANRAAELTNGLLAFSRKQVLNVKPVNVNETIESIEKILRSVIGEGIELIVSLSDENIIINADTTQLEHVLINLATNARDAMPDGGTLKIGTSTVRKGEEHIGEKPGSYALITVSDTGIGMSKDIQSRIFEPFFTTKEVGKGTGLGLATVYGVVKQHGGSIAVYSEPGAGTAFKIYLPLHAGQTAEITGEAPLPMKGGNETILLVEDDPLVRKAIKGLLLNAGYQVFEAADGDEALSVFKENSGKIQMAILDVIMPKRSGREVYEELKITSPEIKVLFMSGHAGEVLSRSGVLDENLNFIAKPVEPDQMLIKIREILDA